MAELAHAGTRATGDAATRAIWMRLLRDAGFATLVAFGLFALMVGIKTEQSLNNQIVLTARPALLAGLLLAVFLGALALGYLRVLRERRARTARVTPAFSQVGRAVGLIIAAAVFVIAVRAFPLLTQYQNVYSIGGMVLLVMFLGLLGLLIRGLFYNPEAVRAVLVPAFLGFIAVFPLLALHYAGWQGALKWIDNFGIQILIYVMLGWGLNIVVGLAGLLDLGYVAFYAVGAYSYALLATSDPVKMWMAELIGPQFWSLWAFWICLPVAGILAAFWGIILGFPVLRLRGDYLAIVTLAFGEIIRLVLINWVDFSGGYAGVSTIPRPTLFGVPFTAADNGFAAQNGFEFSPIYRTIFLYYLILVLALVTALVATRLRRLPVGRAWEALREDEIACRSLGINTVNTKLTAFSLGAMFGGFAGAFFAARQGFISPESFTFLESAQVLAIVVLGGSGSLLGVVIGAIVLVGGFEILRELEVLRLIFGEGFDPVQYRGLIFGLGMVLIMIWKPRGLISSRQPTVFLKEKRRISGDLVSEGHG